MDDGVDIGAVVTGVVASIWDMMLGTPVTPLEKRPQIADDRAETFAGCVHILGDWHGSVSLQCSRSLARRAAGLFFQMDQEQIGREAVEDALRELTNMTGGNLKTTLGERCVLTVPKVHEVHGFDFALPECRELAVKYFETLGETLVVRVHEDIQDINAMIRESGAE